MKKHKFSLKSEHYCYLRWQKAQGKEERYELFWINMHLKFGELR